LIVTDAKDHEHSHRFNLNDVFVYDYGSMIADSCVFSYKKQSKQVFTAIQCWKCCGPGVFALLACHAGHARFTPST